MFDVICIGDITLDNFFVLDEAKVKADLKNHKNLLCLNYSEKLIIKKTFQAIGGNAGNVAVGLKKLGLKVNLISQIGQDINGKIILSELKKFKLKTDLIITDKKPTRTAVILNYQAERTILSHYIKRNYQKIKIPLTKYIYYTSLGPTFEKIQKQIINFTKNHPKTKLVFNPGTFQMQHLNIIHKIFPYTDILILNKDEAEKIFKTKFIKKQLKIGIKKFNLKTIIITNSHKGSYLLNKNSKQIIFTPTFNTKAVAKTGAGDAYASGFLAGLIYNQNFKQAMLWGTANASGVIQKFGAQNGLLTKKQIKQFLKNKQLTKN